MKKREEKKRQERRNRKALMNNSKIQRLPAGVDTGKFLEEQLRQNSAFRHRTKESIRLFEVMNDNQSFVIVVCNIFSFKY